VQRIGLTAALAAARALAHAAAAHGAAVLDADAISRQLTAVGGAAIPAITLQLGPDVIAADGAMNRDVRALAF
jgi:dephospho-CoA kinase